MGLLHGTTLAVVDIRRRRLPHPLTGLLWAASAVCFAVEVVLHHDGGRLLRAGISAAVVAGLFLALALALPGQLGLGDVDLAGVLAFTLAWLALRNLVWWPALSQFHPVGAGQDECR